MNLEHIALNVTDPKEVIDFYQNVLGMVEIKNFILEKGLAKQFFGISKDTSVYLMQKDELFSELFIVNKSYNQGFNHICIEVEKREDIVSKAKDNSYKCIRREREHFDQIFITDKSGNIFEIKNVDKNLN